MLSGRTITQLGRPAGDDKRMTVLMDMNELEANHEEFVKSLAQRVALI
jgi:hypothetical protein